MLTNNDNSNHDDSDILDDIRREADASHFDFFLCRLPF